MFRCVPSLFTFSCSCLVLVSTRLLSVPSRVSLCAHVWRVQEIDVWVLPIPDYWWSYLKEFAMTPLHAPLAGVAAPQRLIDA